MKKLLLFGSSGSIGQSISDEFCSQGWTVVPVVRDHANDIEQADFLIWSSDDGRILNSDNLKKIGPFDGVVWAQGKNTTDSILDFNSLVLDELWNANVLTIAKSLHQLLEDKLLNQSASLCVISSIWQDLARQNKMSYCTTKSAIKGLVNSIAIDLGAFGFRINAILPGALDTPMTRQNLSAEQITYLETLSPLHRLSSLSDVSKTVYWLVSPDSGSVTGQFIKVDSGFSYARIL